MTASGLDELEPLLVRLRRLDGIAEKKRGVFYRGPRAFLHFHEDPSGFHADVRLRAELERFRVESTPEQDELLAEIERSLAGEG